MGFDSRQGQEIIFHFLNVQTGSVLHSTSYAMGAGSSFPCIFDRSPSSISEFRNEWNYTSISHTCLYDVERDKFNFTAINFFRCIIKENLKVSEHTNLSTCLFAASLLISDHLPNTYFSTHRLRTRTHFPVSDINILFKSITTVCLRKSVLNNTHSYITCFQHMLFSDSQITS
jgi:hypothetical protein